VIIKVNDDVCRYFEINTGLKQVNPLSLILFNIVADMLAVMIERTKVDGVIPDLVDGGLCILQYTDDTILFMEHDFEKAKKLNLF
jgi:hypothetical protein